MADVIFILISVFVCGFAVTFIVLAIASIFYRVYTLRTIRRKIFRLYPAVCNKTCEVATINGRRRFSCADVEKASAENLHNNEIPTAIRTMSTTSTATSFGNEPVKDAENKSPKNSARSITDGSTTATETEEQLLGAGHLPRDIQAEQDFQEAIKKAFGPPEPKLD